GRPEISAVPHIGANHIVALAAPKELAAFNRNEFAVIYACTISSCSVLIFALATRQQQHEERQTHNVFHAYTVQLDSSNFNLEKKLTCAYLQSWRARCDKGISRILICNTRYGAALPGATTTTTHPAHDQSDIF